MSESTFFSRGKETVTITPAGDKFIIVMVLDSPETLEVMTKIQKKGFEEET